MARLSPVVWSEGMHLAPHHFQAQSRFFEESVHFALASLFFQPYGLAGCELDAEALRNGTAAIVHARGVMPDGLAFRFPDDDPPPAPLAVRELFSPTQDSHLLLLTIAPYRRDAGNIAFDTNGGTSGARYVAEERLATDEMTGRGVARLHVGRKNFHLALDAAIPEGAVGLPIARVRRDGAGSFLYDPAYVPPSLQVGASEALLRLLARVVEMLEEKSRALAPGRGEARRAGEYAGHEVATFWLLHAIHQSLAPLRHHLQVRRSRPEDVYRELARLAGALCTFTLDAHPRDVPAYDHEQLGECFAALERQIRAGLEIAVPSNCLTIPLRPAAPYLHVGTIDDARAFARARWVLSVRSSVGELATVERVPALVKVCASRFTLELVRRAYPGMALQHLPVPPAALSPRVDRQYFAIGLAGPCWGELERTHEIGVYVPDGLPDAEFELHVLLAD